MDLQQLSVTAKKAKSMRNAERRRERSKVAARCRRGRECEIFTTLSDTLPIPESNRTTLDKASIMRLALCTLKLRKMLGSGTGRNGIPSFGQFISDFEGHITSALGGFILVCSLEGDVVYAGEGIGTHLGVSQYEIMGQSIFDFSHQYDHTDIRSLLKPEDSVVQNKKSVLFRMKCTVTSRGRNAHLRSTCYKVVNCIGRIFQGKWLVSICEPLHHPSDVDIPLNPLTTFVTRHSPDMKFEVVDELGAALLGYRASDLMGKSLFQFVHALDGERFAKTIKAVFEKEQGLTERYRFLSKGGGWIWLVTQATMIQGRQGGGGGVGCLQQNKGNSSSSTPASVVCIHFITSGREAENQVLSGIQIGKRVEVPVVSLAKKRAALLMASASLNIPMKQNMTPKEEEQFIADLLAGLNNAKCSTKETFAPRTEEMDTGYLMPMDENTLMVTKEEPIDLTHLAPIAGDECIPLEDIPIFEDFLAGLGQKGESFSFLDEEATEKEIPKMLKQLEQQSTQRKVSMAGTTVKPPLCSPPEPFLLHSDPILGSTSSLSGGNMGYLNQQHPSYSGKRKLLQPFRNDPFEPPSKIPKIQVPQGNRKLIWVPTRAHPSQQTQQELMEDILRAVGMGNQLPLMPMAMMEQETPMQQMNRFMMANNSSKMNITNSTGNMGSLFGDNHAMSLHELTRQDCEVNAPIEMSDLLQGPDLLKALEAADVI